MHPARCEEVIRRGKRPSTRAKRRATTLTLRGVSLDCLFSQHPARRFCRGTFETSRSWFLRSAALPAVPVVVATTRRSRPPTPRSARTAAQRSVRTRRARAAATFARASRSRSPTSPPAERFTRSPRAARLPVEAHARSSTGDVRRSDRHARADARRRRMHTTPRRRAHARRRCVSAPATPSDVRFAKRPRGSGTDPQESRKL